jgi:HEPN domain-containing protein
VLKTTLAVDPSRTTAHGLLYFAEQFWIAAKATAKPEQRTPEHFRIPSFVAYYLAGHAIELALKAFLRADGRTLDQLKTIGHDIEKLADESKGSGFSLSDKARAVVRLIGGNYTAKRFEYIVTGVYTLPIWTDVEAAVEEVILESAKTAGSNLTVPESKNTR